MTVSYENRTLFRYEGPLDMMILPQIVRSIEQLLTAEHTRPPIRRKIISSLIELAQNMIHYGIAHPLQSSTISLQKTDNAFVLSTINAIHTSQELFLRTYIDNLLSMTKNELEALYQNIFTKNDYTDAGGAGLGILQVLIKADHFSYQIEPVDNEHARFTVEATFSTSK